MGVTLGGEATRMNKSVRDEIGVIVLEPEHVEEAVSLISGEPGRPHPPRIFPLHAPSWFVFPSVGRYIHAIEENVCSIASLIRGVL